VFDRVRLTVAPLRYGAGIKGKVLDSLAAGVPCVMSQVAAEGLPLRPSLRGLIATDAPQFARLILRLHAEEAGHAMAVQSGRSLIRRHNNEAVVDNALRGAIEGRGLTAARRTA
jgi:hypothetical protein